MDSIRLGYACINDTLGAGRPRIFCSRTATIATLVAMGPEAAAAYCRSLALQNVADLLAILQWNESKAIRLFRITSTLFPHAGNHLLPPAFTRRKYFQGDIEFARTALELAGKYAREHNHRLTFHVQPYLQMASPDAGVFRRTVFDLNVHARILHILGTESPVIIMHGGGVYQAKNQTKADAKAITMLRWVKNWRTLSPELRKWITLENDESHYGVSDLLPICERVGIPFCFDVFHNSISAERVDVTPALLRRVAATWRRCRPKFHLSEQAADLRFGAHADLVNRIPEYLINLRNVDIMIEAKLKERAVMRLYKKYFVRTADGWRLH